nr:MAG TPA: hypothetical protein [Caudoviricetes sp.]
MISSYVHKQNQVSKQTFLESNRYQEMFTSKAELAYEHTV